MAPLPRAVLARRSACRWLCHGALVESCVAAARHVHAGCTSAGPSTRWWSSSRRPRTCSPSTTRWGRYESKRFAFGRATAGGNGGRGVAWRAVGTRAIAAGAELLRRIRVCTGARAQHRRGVRGGAGPRAARAALVPAPAAQPRARGPPGCVTHLTMTRCAQPPRCAPTVAVAIGLWASRSHPLSCAHASRRSRPTHMQTRQPAKAKAEHTVGDHRGGGSDPQVISSMQVHHNTPQRPGKPTLTVRARAEQTQTRALGLATREDKTREG